MIIVVVYGILWPIDAYSIYRISLAHIFLNIRTLPAEASHLGKVNLLEQRWDPLEWHLGWAPAWPWPLDPSLAAARRCSASAWWDGNIW